MAQLAYLPELKGQARAAEFSVSVLPEGRSQSFGTSLLFSVLVFIWRATQYPTC
jgi:hypothetical protein